MVSFTACNKHPTVNKQVNVVFRFDDYSACSNTDMELRIIDAFREHDACLTIGVIPYVCAGDIHDPSPQDLIPLTSMKGDILKNGINEGILDVALHGYSHQTISLEQWTEFSGLDYNSQVERLAKGKTLLEGMIDTPVITFVPPWNRYDLNTLRALEALGFSTLSADNKRGEVTEAYKLNFLPYSCSISKLRDTVKASRTSSDPQPVIVVLFHEYDFKEIDEKRGRITYQEFYDLLNWLNAQKYVRLLSISQATQGINDLSAKRQNFIDGKICCCAMLSLHKELPLPLDFWETGFRAELSTDSCVGCGQCAEKCPVQALSFPEPAHEQKKKNGPFIDPDRCIGCGQRVASCRPRALSLVPRPGQAPPPTSRNELNAELLAHKKQPLPRTRVIGKLAKGIIVKRDLRLM